MSDNAVHSAIVQGIQAVFVQVQTFCSKGTPYFEIEGMPELQLRDARVRVRSAIRSASLPFPEGKVDVQLLPRETRKDNAYALDLPMALSVLGIQTGDVIVLGELSLTGSIRPIRGASCVAHTLAKRGGGMLMVPADCAAECTGYPGVRVLTADDLRDAVRVFSGLPASTGSYLAMGYGEYAYSPALAPEPPQPLDWSGVYGNQELKQRLESAAAHKQSVLLIGTPGTGSTMLSRRLPSILPPMTEDEAQTVTRIHSVAGLLPARTKLLNGRPFRAPHYTASTAALTGGGAHPFPGEVSLAQHGVLFLDEIHKFPRSCIEVLQGALSQGQVEMTRVKVKVAFPAKPVMVVATALPCPCGHKGTPRCQCSPAAIKHHEARIPWSMFDAVIHVPPAQDSTACEGSKTVQARISKAWQAARDTATEAAQ